MTTSKPSPEETTSSESLHADGNVEVSTANLPVADIRPVSAGSVVSGSKLWILTLFCLLFSIGLVWWSLPDKGHEILIRFPEGHGLEAEDVVSFRGIDVGIVERVELIDDLSAVEVTVKLKEFAGPLAREGTRFWIVRPSLSLSGVSGLETAVGNKYIGLLPGQDGAAPKSRFEGLAIAPPDALESAGVEIIIRGAQRFSVSEGAPISCRGVDVGRVLSVGLSQDSRHVDIRAKIFKKYRKLVTTKTRFWAISGVDLDISIGGGLKLNTESLETLARGGVALLVVENGGQPVSPGHVFELFRKPEEEWFASANSVRVTGIRLRGATPLIATWTQSGLFGKTQKETSFVGVPFRTESGDTRLLSASDIFELPRKAVEDSYEVKGVLSQQVLEPTEEGSGEQNNLFGKWKVDTGFAKRWVSEKDDVRWPAEPEECFAVRADNSGPRVTYLDYPIEPHQLAMDKEAPSNWFMNRFDGDRSVWHGAPVLAAKDGKIIGALYVKDHQATVVCFSKDFNLKN